MANWKDRLKEAAAEASGEAPPKPGQRYQYDVVELREKLFSGTGDAPTNALRRMLNERAADGWQLKHMISASVAGMVTKRDGWMVIFEKDLRG